MTTERTCSCACHRAPQHDVATCRCCPARPEPVVCPIPPVHAQPGTVDIPQPTPFAGPIRHVTETPSPPPGADEAAWFSQQVSDMLANGPVFGPRKDEFLPMIVVRYAVGDNGTRPAQGAFWESPDIYAISNIEAADAPLMPEFASGVIHVEAGKPATLYAHVWNVGRAPAFGVRVEFYWFNPSLGFSRADANLIGAAWVDLADRFTRYDSWVLKTGESGDYLSRGAHAVVRCPQTWTPVMQNGGHECLIVRAFEPILDAVPYDEFYSGGDRHVAQRNIAVVEAHSPAEIDLPLSLGYPTTPGNVEVRVETAAPNAAWLPLLGSWGKTLTPARGEITAGLMPPAPRGARVQRLSNIADDCRKVLLEPRERFTRGCEPLQIQFHASAAALQPNEAALFRITQRQDGRLIGGYSVVLVRR